VAPVGSGASPPMRPFGDLLLNHLFVARMMSAAGHIRDLAALGLGTNPSRSSARSFPFFVVFFLRDFSAAVPFVSRHLLLVRLYFA